MVLWLVGCGKNEETAPYQQHTLFVSKTADTVEVHTWGGSSFAVLPFDTVEHWNTYESTNSWGKEYKVYTINNNNTVYRCCGIEEGTNIIY